MNRLPQGFGVLVTRPAQQAETLSNMIEDHGGIAIRLPLLDIATVLRDRVEALYQTPAQQWDWRVFVSANAVRSAVELFGPQWLQESKVKTAAIGQATAQALVEQGVTVDLKPKQQSNSEALLAEAAWADVGGQRFLIVRGEGGRELLAETLRQRGAAVEYAEVYRRVFPPLDAQVLQARWRAGEVDAAILTSGEALQCLAQLLRGEEELWRHTPLVVIGSRLGEQARALGWAQVVEAGASDQDIFDALIRIGQAFIKSNQPRG